LVVALVALTAAAAVLGATTDHRAPTQNTFLSPFYSPEGTLTTVPSSAPTTLPPESGYRGIENFCAVAPLTGTIHYDGTSGELTGVLTVGVGGLPPDDEVYVAWSNDHVRAPDIAAFATDSKGTSLQSSVEVSRLGEVRGVEVWLLAVMIPNPVLGRLEPC
jgi:hypothetical protein